MKKLSSFITMLMLVSTSAFAQFTNTSTNTTMASSYSSNSKEVNTDEWTGITASYDMRTIAMDFEDAEDLDLNGFSIGYAKSFSISKDMPLFVEAGVNLSYAKGDESISGYVDIDDYYYDAEMNTEYTYYGITIPVNLAYKFVVNDNVQIIPYTGLYLKGNIVAKADVSLNIGGYDESEEFDLFDDDEAKSLGFDDSWSRLNIGWQIGAKMAFKQFNVGVSYGLDLNEVAKKTKMKNLSIGIGYTF